MWNSAPRIGSNRVLCLGCFPCAPRDEHQCNHHSLPGKDEQVNKINACDCDWSMTPSLNLNIKETISMHNLSLKNKWFDIVKKKNILWTKMKNKWLVKLTITSVSVWEDNLLISKFRPVSQSKERNTLMFNGSLQLPMESLGCQEVMQASQELCWLLCWLSSLLDPWQSSGEVVISRYKNRNKTY